MSTNSGQPSQSGSPLSSDAPSAFDQAPAFTFAQDYNPLFPMGDTLPLEALDHLDPEETFDVLFGAPAPDEAETTEPTKGEPDLATMKVARPPMPIPPLPLPPLANASD